MRLIAVTDIFGKTKFFDELLADISEKYEEIEIIDPYDGFEINFLSEQAAYNEFQGKIGLDLYAARLLEHLGNRPPSKLHLIGFSVGASAVWAVSEMLNIGVNAKATCFYSSQIRHLLDVKPNFKIDLFFPRSETSYEVDEVIAVLQNKANVNCYKTEYLHGFMNKKSVNFNQQGYSEYLEILKLI